MLFGLDKGLVETWSHNYGYILEQSWVGVRISDAGSDSNVLFLQRLDF